MGGTRQDPPDLPNPESFGRDTGHDAEQFWNSTGLFLALEKILMKLYQLPAKMGLALITTESGRLEDRDQKVMEQCFTNLSGNNKQQAKNKVTKVLSMVDGFWTREERDNVVN